MRTKGLLISCNWVLRYWSYSAAPPPPLNEPEFDRTRSHATASYSLGRRNQARTAAVDASVRPMTVAGSQRRRIA